MSKKIKIFSIVAIYLVLTMLSGCAGANDSNQNHNNTENPQMISQEEALEIAKDFWDWEPYEENGDPVSHKSTTIICNADEHTEYYFMYLQWWVDTHWSAIDYLYIHKVTGEYTQEKPE